MSTKELKLTGIAGIRSLIALSLAAICVLGCHSDAGYKKTEVAAGGLQSAASEVQAESRALEITMGTLNDMLNAPQPDLKAQYKRFSASLDDFIASARKAESTGRVMQQKNQAYLQAWDKQISTINYEVIKNASVNRRTEVSNHCEALTQRYAETHAVVEPLISYLLDIRTALGSDLTPGGLQSVKNIVNHAGENSGKVQTALARLSDELNNSSAVMQPVALQSSNSQAHP